MNIIGVDAALGKTGIASDDRAWTYTTRTVGSPRLREIWLQIWDQVQVADEDLVVLEGYSYASVNQAHQMGELGGHVRYQLWDHGVPHVVVAPGTLKKFATGKGNAAKDAMIATAARLGCPADDNNAVDAWWLRQMGLYRQSVVTDTSLPVPATKYRDEAVDTVTWPNLAD